MLRSLLASFAISIAVAISIASQAAPTESYPELKPPIVDEDTRQQIKEMQADLGLAIPYYETPALYRLVVKAFRRVAAAQEDLVKDQFLPINHVLILDSPFVNAFVYMPHVKGVRVGTNVVVVTTEMLRTLIDLDEDRLQGYYPNAQKADRSGLEIEAGMHRLAGVLAHELAHPLDTIVWNYKGDSGLSIEQTYGKRASQALEIKTDILGSELVRAADLPEDSVLAAQTRTLDEHQSSNTLAEAFSSHPNVSLRMTAMRMFLTVQRLKQGVNQNVTPIRISKSEQKELAADLNKISVGKGGLPWVEPRTLQELVTRLKRLPTLSGNSMNEEKPTLEFNRLLLIMDREIAKQEASQGKVSKQDAAILLDGIRAIFRLEFEYPIWSGPERKNNLSALPDSRYLLDLPPHLDSVNKLKFYSSAEYLAALPEPDAPDLNFDDEDNKAARTARKLISNIQILANFMPTKAYMKKYGMILADWEIAAYSLNGYRPSILENFKARELISGLLPLMVERTLLSSEEQMIATFFGSLRKGSAIPYFFKKYSETDPKEISTYEALVKAVRQTRVYAKSGQKNANDEYAYFSAIAKTIWEHRTDFAMLELIAVGVDKDKAVNWDLIGELLGLDLQQMMRQISIDLVADLNVDNVAGLGVHIKSSQHLQIKGLRTYQKVDSLSRETENVMPPWYTTELGQKVAQLRLNPNCQDPCHWGATILGRTVIGYDPHVRSKFYSQHVSEYLRNNRLNSASVGDYLRTLEAKFKEMWWVVGTANGNGKGGDIPLSLSTFAIAVEQANIPLFDKQQILNYVFLRQEGSEEGNSEFFKDYYKWTTLDQESVDQILEILIGNHLIESTYDLYEVITSSVNYKPLAQIRAGEVSKDEGTGHLSDYYAFIDRIAENAIVDLVSVSSFDEFNKWLKLINSPYRLKIDRSNSNTPRIMDLRNALAKKALELEGSTRKRSLEERLALYLKLTGSGGSELTDQYLETYILPHQNELLVWLNGILSNGRVYSHELQLRIAKQVLDPRIAALETKEDSLSHELFNVISDLNRMVPQGSLAKDDFLESIGWRLQLDGIRLLSLIEDQKTSNWRKENPNFVNLGSALASSITKMAYSRRLSFLDYLIDPRAHKDGMPDEVMAELYEQAMNQIIKDQNANNQRVRRDQLKDQATDTARALKLKIELFLRDSAPTERIPLIEMLLISGPEAIIKHTDYPHNVTRDYLNYGQDSVEEKMLLSQLAIIPPHEVGPSLAYLLSQSKSDKRTIVSIFELHGTVGKKFGQLTSIWQIFGPEIAAETKHLKDRAAPMTRAEIRARMADVMDVNFSEKIKLRKIVGSASIKTIVKIDVAGKGTMVMAIQPGSTKNQIATNLDFGKKFLDELEKRNLVSQSKMLANLISALREQLEEEVDFVYEAKKHKLSDEIVRSFLQPGDELKGWAIEVPRLREDMPLEKSIAFYDYVEGQSFSELSPALQAKVGPALVRATLGMLFRTGFMDADRHMGNFLINAKEKKIYALDWGQLEDFRPLGEGNDPRQILVTFMNGILTKNIDDVYAQLKMMSHKGTKAPKMTKQLRVTLEQAFAQTELTDQLVQTITAATEAGFDIDRRYSFGAMKGLLILYGENYVSREMFSQIMMEEVMGWMGRSMTGDQSIYTGSCADFLQSEGTGLEEQ